MLNICNNEISKIREIVVMGRQKDVPLPRFSERKREFVIRESGSDGTCFSICLTSHEKSDKKRSHKLPQRKPPKTTGVGKVP